MTMKSLIQQAIARPQERADAAGRKARECPAPVPALDTNEEELRKLQAGLKIHVRVVGCGRSGARSADLCSEEVDSTLVDPYALTVEGEPLDVAPLAPQISVTLDKDGWPANERKILQPFDETDLLFLTTSLADSSGCHLAEFVARSTARMRRPLVISLVSTPPPEPSERPCYAGLDGLEGLRRVSDTTIVIQTEKLRDLLPEAQAAAAPRVIEELMMTAIRGIVAIGVGGPAPIHLDFVDLQTVFRNHEAALIGLGEGTSDHPADVLAEALGSLLLGPVDLQKVTGAFFQIIAGPAVTVPQATKLAWLVSTKLPVRIPSLWGMSRDQSPKSETSVKLLLILTGMEWPFVI
ncbi:MAG: hypothetical protein HKL79_03660 [Thermoplasmata archaeon]|nr:hypothetical protein [Thermoplasmata archaeon]